MSYWEGVVKSHEVHARSKKYPTREDGLQAVLFLKSFFEHIGCDVIPRDHPFHSRLGVGMETNYQWLVQYTRKLIVGKYIAGFQSVGKRLANTREFFAANNEIERLSYGRRINCSRCTHLDS
jgi:hypothetical protein